MRQSSRKAARSATLASKQSVIPPGLPRRLRAPRNDGVLLLSVFTEGHRGIRYSPSDFDDFGVGHTLILHWATAVAYARRAAFEYNRQRLSAPDWQRL